MENNKEKVFEYKRIKNEGAYLYLIKLKGNSFWRLHRYDGPAISPINKTSSHQKGYHINGIPYNKEEYNEIMKNREGIPFYKQPNNKIRQ